MTKDDEIKSEIKALYAQLLDMEKAFELTASSVDAHKREMATTTSRHQTELDKLNKVVSLGNGGGESLMGKALLAGQELLAIKKGLNDIGVLIEQHFKDDIKISERHSHALSAIQAKLAWYAGGLALLAFVVPIVIVLIEKIWR